MRFTCSCGSEFDTRRLLSIHVSSNKWEHFESGRNKPDAKVSKKARKLFDRSRRYQKEDVS